VTNRILALDTSNYKTSAALYAPDSGAWKSCGKLLDVPQGTLGLRQSDALFQHVKRLPDIIAEATAQDDGVVRCVAYADRPRDLPDSYMPCFLAGGCAAQSIASANHIPVYTFSHQQGHLAAAAFSVNRLDLLQQPFLAWHLSGGTTELLYVQPDPDRIIRAEIIGGTNDVSAGQIIDRVGVAVGTAFPAGPYVEKLALAAEKSDAFTVKIKEGYFSFSGLENQFRKRLAEDESAEQVCAFVLNSVIRAVQRVTQQMQQHYHIPVLFSGGVSVCSLLQKAFAGQPDVLFAQHGLGGDNALGIAVLASMMR